MIRRTVAAIAVLLALAGCADDEGDAIPPAEDPAIMEASDTYRPPYVIETIDTPHGPAMCISARGDTPGGLGMDCIPIGWDPTTVTEDGE